MRQDIVLEIPGFSPQLRQQIENLNLPEADKGPLLQAEPTRVVITSRPPTLTITLAARKLLPRSGLDALAAAMTETLGFAGSLRVVWDVHYPQGCVHPEAYLTEHWTDLLVVYSRLVPMAGAYLSLARFSNGNGSRVSVHLPNEMSITALRRLQGEKILGSLLSERLGEDLSVKFALGDFSEEVRLREALYQRRIREELERLQAEADAESGMGETPVAAGPGSAAAVPIRAPWKIVFGRKITQAPVPIVQVQEEEDHVVFEGELVAFENKTLRTGRQLVLMDIYDKTGSMNARLFLDAGKQLSGEIKRGAYVRLRGTVQHDKYSQDLCLLVRDIALGVKPTRADGHPERRVELHAHTQMSAMDALAGVEALVAKAAAFGHPAVAVTDHGVVQGFPEAAAAGAKHGIKVIYGMEGYLVEDHWEKNKQHKPYHVTLLVAKPEGIKNLYRLVSASHLTHFYRHPRIPRSLLAAHREGLLLGTACEQGELFRGMLDGRTDEELAETARWYDYLEIMPRGNNAFLLREGRVADEEALLEMNRRIVRIGRLAERPVVATGDVHFLEPGDEVFRSILQAGMGFEDAAQQAPLYFKTTEEMLAEFAYLGECEARTVVIDNPRVLAEQVEAIEPLKRTFHPPRLKHAEDELRTLAFARAREVYGDPLPDLVAQRLEREITAITQNHFASLFLIARRLVQKSLEDGYLVGSRGSVGSSLTATMLGITEVNPLAGHYRCPQCRWFEPDPGKRIGADLPDRDCPACGAALDKDGFDIPFEVFMGFEGDKLPDIDLNFSGEYQGTAHKYLEEIFDREHIFRAGTISTVAERIAYGFVKKYVEENQLRLREAEINRLTRGCAGVKKTTGQHPGGIMIVPDDMDIHDFTPVQRPADDHTSGIITTHLDYHAIHDALLKLDILGHDDPTSLRRLGDWTGVDVRSIALDDPDTLGLFSGLGTLGVDDDRIKTTIGTLGIPEFGTEFVRQMLEATRPTTFSELVRISGLSHGTDVWLNNAADLIAAKTATLSTVISARDDIMNYLIGRGLEPALAFKIMESVRKGRGLAPDQERIMRETGVPDWYIDSCKKIKYIFPKAHAVAYCMMAFRIAYFKVHFPTAFYANYFSLNPECFDAERVVHGGPAGVEGYIEETKKRQDLTAKEKNNLVVLDVVREAFARGLRFRPVSLSESDPRIFKITADRELLPPLISLNGLGLTCALRIHEERQGRAFKSVEDLARRCGANKNVVEIMTLHGCLDILPKADQVALF